MAAKIFVYGSLMKGFFNYERFLKSRAVKVEKGRTSGRLYHLGNKGYPGMVSGESHVYGEIITYEDEIVCLMEMDKLEGFSGDYSTENVYNRMPIEVLNLDTDETMILDAYVYNDKAQCNADDERIHIAHGSWSDYMGVS